MSKHHTSEAKLHISEEVQPRIKPKRELKKSPVPAAKPLKGTNADNQYR